MSTYNVCVVKKSGKPLFENYLSRGMDYSACVLTDVSSQPWKVVSCFYAPAMKWRRAFSLPSVIRPSVTLYSTVRVHFKTMV